jgi:hypothetical protein
VSPPKTPEQAVTLYGLAQDLRALCEKRATEGRLHDDDERRFVALRKEIMTSTLCSGRAPVFLASVHTANDFWTYIQPKFKSYAERRRFLGEQFQPLLAFLEGAETSSASASAIFLDKLNSEHVKHAWQAASTRVESDPEGAMTAARTLVETVCKHLLDSLGATYGDSDDLPGLYRLVAQSMNLAPSQHTVQVFKQILGGCTAVVEGLGAVRNRLGDAHGKGRMAVRPQPRHAELVVNLALSMSLFLVRTWEARSTKTT